MPALPIATFSPRLLDGPASESGELALRVGLCVCSNDEIDVLTTGCCLMLVSDSTLVNCSMALAAFDSVGSSGSLSLQILSRLLPCLRILFDEGKRRK